MISKQLQKQSMMRGLLTWGMVCLVLMAAQVFAQEEAAESTDRTFDLAEMSAQEKLERSVADLVLLNSTIMDEKVPLNKQLNELEAQLQEVRQAYQQTSRLLDSRTLDLSNLRSEIEGRQAVKVYLSGLLSDYVRNFETRVHIAESKRYKEAVEAAKLAPENTNLSDEEIFKIQAELVGVSMERLLEAMGGTQFEGHAVDSTGLIKPGTFTLIGPVALYKSSDGESVGTVEQRLGSLEPTIVPFESTSMTEATAELVETGKGQVPLDPTLGNAHKIEATKETLIDEIKKGGAVMYPIVLLALAALLVALVKWIELAMIKKPSKKGFDTLLKAVASGNQQDATKAAQSLEGPTGEVLSAGVAHINEPVELIEEVMYEKILTTKLKLQRYLPFVAISASSAPLLGLLGTVTGIINTFKLLTVFGSGDVKALSGGISEALITTKYGLIVAIPSLLLHAFLSRKARGMSDMMEKNVISFVNQIHKSSFKKSEPTNGGIGGITQEQLQLLFKQLSALEPAKTAETVVEEERMPAYAVNSAGSIMDTSVFSVDHTATVADVISKMRTSNLHEGLNAVCVVDQQGKFLGGVNTRQLLIRPEDTQIESLVDDSLPSVHVDADQTQVKSVLSQPGVDMLPVLNDDRVVVGWIKRNGETVTHGDVL